MTENRFSFAEQPIVSKKLDLCFRLIICVVVEYGLDLQASVSAAQVKRDIRAAVRLIKLNPSVVHLSIALACLAAGSCSSDRVTGVNCDRNRISGRRDNVDGYFAGVWSPGSRLLLDH